MTGSTAQMKAAPRSLEAYAAGVVADSLQSIEEWLDRVLPVGTQPSRLHLAMREAVIPGGKRARPLLTYLVAETYGRRNQELVGRMGAAVEIVHCASLVHDDLPAFDDADTRRGKPSCHAAFGEATAILVGDALLTLAFETLAQASLVEARSAMRLLRLLTNATGSRAGIIGGQGLELQTNVDVTSYHAQKTAALFRAAAAGGAIAAGGDTEVARWARFGDLVGRALQLRDDLSDVYGSAMDLGKPVGQDAAFERPNAVNRYGREAVERELDMVVAEAQDILGEPSMATLPLRALVARVAGRPTMMDML